MSMMFTDFAARGVHRQAHRLLDRSPAPTIANLRDRAIIGMLWHADASVDGVIAVKVKDYYRLNERRWLRLVDDGTERHVLVSAKLEALIDEYLTASGIADALETRLFRSTLSGNGKISARSILRRYVVKLGRNITNLRSVNLSAENAEALIKGIPPVNAVNLRDRAIIGMMVYGSASPKEIAAFRSNDYLDNNEWCCIKLGRSRIVEVPRALHTLMRDYWRAATPDQHALLFGVDRSRSMTPANIEKMIRRRLNDMGAAPKRRAPSLDFTPA
jgi:site-specific recombinase XerD